MMGNWTTGWEGMVVGPLFITALLIFAVGFIVMLMHASIEVNERAGLGVRAERQMLDEHWGKRQINREEYIDRRKALDFSGIII
jgi:uncharacterized membrane protein